MRQFFRLLSYDSEEILTQVVDYVLQDIDPAEFWRGRRACEPRPGAIKLILRPGLPSDYLANPLSWPIGSLQLAKVLNRRAPANLQTFDAPLFEEVSGAQIAGFVIINVCTRLPCLDIQRSKLACALDDPTRILVVYRFAINASKVEPEIHIFRVHEWPHAVIISEELANDLLGKDFIGIAQERCITV
jgi:hypothetical protein